MSDQMFEGLPPEESTPPYRRVTPESLLQDELRKARARIAELEGENASLRSPCSCGVDADEIPMWQIRIGTEGRIAIPAGWSTVPSGRVAVGDRILIQGTHAKWWTRADRAPGCDVSDFELVIRPVSPHSQGTES